MAVADMDDRTRALQSDAEHVSRECCIVCGGRHVETTHSHAIVTHNTAPRISERTRRFCCCDCGARYSRVIELREVIVSVRVQRGAVRRVY